MSSRWIAVAWVVAGLLSLRLAIVTWRAQNHPANGFVTHWTASNLILQGADVRLFYDDEWFSQRVRESEPTVADIYGPNPPTVAMAALPVAWLSYSAARRFVAAASLFMWIGGAVWLAVVLLPDSILRPLLVIVASVFQPAQEGLSHAQLHIPAFGVMLLAWWQWRQAGSKRAHRVVGLALGAVLALKSVGALLWVLLAARRRWTSLVWGVGTIAAFAIAILPVARADAWTAFMSRARIMAASGMLSSQAYQSLPGLIQRLTVRDAVWNPRPLVESSRAGALIAWLAVVVLVGATVARVARRTDSDDASFAAFAALAVAVSPVSLDYHYTLVLLPIALVLARTATERSVVRAVLLAAGIFLIAARLPYLSLDVADGSRALLAYPKLYGALIIWWLALTASAPTHSRLAVGAAS